MNFYSRTQNQLGNSAFGSGKWKSGLSNPPDNSVKSEILLIMALLDNMDVPDFFDIISWKVILLILIVCILRSWLKGAQFKGSDSAKNQVAVVTGASVGIGKQIVRDLCYRGATVYMLCRTMERGQEALSALIQLGCHSDRLKLREVDLASFDTVGQFVQQLKRDGVEKVDILINNAGIMLFPKFQLTKDGHELTWQTNYLSHFLLTELLAPLLEKSSGGGRVINVSALAHAFADPIDLSAIDRRENFDPRQSYAKSKLAQIMHAREWTKRLRLKGSAVTINACHPGLCYTRIMRHTPIYTNSFLRYTLAPFAWFFMKTPKDGAQMPLYLALAKELTGVSGKYYSEMGEKTPGCAEATDEDLCKELYDYSLSVTVGQSDSGAE